MPPEVTYSTRRYVLPTGGQLVLVRWSVTDVMMLVEPTQKNVTTIASPLCGFVGLNPLTNLRPNWPMALFCWSRTMSPASDCRPTGTRCTGGGPPRGPLESLHAPASQAAAPTLGRTVTVARWAGRGVIARC